MNKSLLSQLLLLLRTNWGAQLASVVLLIWVIGSLFLVFHPPRSGIFSEETELTYSNQSNFQVDQTGNRLWLLTNDGLLFSPDKGLSWNWQYRLESNKSDLQELFLLETQTNDTGYFGTDKKYNLWAVGNNNRILFSDNAGNSWNENKACEKRTGKNYTLNSVFFIDEKKGWAVGEQGIICVTNDAGETWSTQTSGVEASLKSVYFINNHGWAVGYDVILFTENGGEIWNQLDLHKNIAGMSEYETYHYDAKNFKQVRFIDEINGWIVGDNGVLLSTTNGGKNWSFSKDAMDLVNDQNWYSFSSITGKTVPVLAAIQNKLLIKKDINTEWEIKKSFDSSTHISQIKSTGAQIWLLLGDGSPEILTSSDDGSTWNRIVPKSYGLSVNYWFATLACGLIFLIGAWQARPQANVAANEQDALAAMFSADRPQQGAELDALGSRYLAWAVCRFLRHRRTEPPLTIAIDAPWGGGKSSMMNWLREDLERFGYRPIWFNAWHYEKQEQMFPALMEQIRRNALPPWLSVEGIRFRSFIFKKRFTEYPLLFLFCLVLSAFAYGYYDKNKDILTLEIKQAGTCFLEQAFPKQPLDKRDEWQKPCNPKTVANHSGNHENNSPSGLLDYWQLLLGTPLIALLKSWFEAFKEPDTLFTKLFNKSDERNSRRETAVKEQFANDFSAVTDALSKPLVIFIDDLDRCHYSSVCEVLETVNFLSLTGRCYVIFGMWQSGVELAVGLRFAEAAMEHAIAMQDGTIDITSEEGKAHIRRTYGRLYLEKLINIWIHLPPMDRCATEKILITDQDGAEFTKPGKTGLWFFLSDTLINFGRRLKELGARHFMQPYQEAKRKTIVLSWLNSSAKGIWFFFRWILARVVWLLPFVVIAVLLYFLVLILEIRVLSSSDNLLPASIILQGISFIISPSRWRSVAFSEILPAWCNRAAFRALFQVKYSFKSIIQAIAPPKRYVLVGRFFIKQFLIVLFIYLLFAGRSDLQFLRYLIVLFASLGLLYCLPTRPILFWITKIGRKLLPEQAPPFSKIFGFASTAGLLYGLFLITPIIKDFGEKWPPTIITHIDATKNQPVQEKNKEEKASNQLTKSTRTIANGSPSLKASPKDSALPLAAVNTGSGVVKATDSAIDSGRSNQDNMAAVKPFGICRMKTALPPMKPSLLKNISLDQSLLIKKLTTQTGVLKSPVGGYLIFIAIVLIVILVSVVRTLREALETTDDTPEFKESLKFWTSVLHARFSTPRRIKRFINDLRFKAICAAPAQVRDRTLWESIWEHYINPQTQEDPEMNSKNRQEHKLLMHCILQACCGQDYKSYLDSSGNLAADWKERIKINPDLVNQFGIHWAEQLMAILTEKIQTLHK